MPDTKRDIVSRLQKDILQWEGYRPPPDGTRDLMGLGPVEATFPNGVFPLGAIHELVCGNTEQATASGGFITGLLSVLMQNGGVCVWIGLSGNLYPSALKAFGVDPDKVIFINLLKDKDVLWAMEESLKCGGLAAVIGELREIDFKQSRRLQLAVEQSRVTGFILRNQSDKIGSTACVARWKIKPLPSEPVDGLPGLGFPRWQVELLRVRNGQQGKWIIEWSDGKFAPVSEPVIKQQELMAG
ncbi:ImuA family protein [Mucilaginibacter gotjawali]|uniref:SOS cell division inhibitor n=2 Tax=Mucilaginibacter gotjawali TaxID=1550579 RepID=A0A0X8X258_9SPHI|nr:Error-prone repair protein ImuA [Mucilaginibacter gotjawali]MBB3058395.1 protein ImuA [Mucilaginibacter gotjawali]BAU53777.1 SOS cell division inhibitor [Mucilaginibacter gotjawali]